MFGVTNGPTYITANGKTNMCLPLERPLRIKDTVGRIFHILQEPGDSCWQLIPNPIGRRLNIILITSIAQISNENLATHWITTVATILPHLSFTEYLIHWFEFLIYFAEIWRIDL